MALCLSGTSGACAGFQMVNLYLKSHLNGILTVLTPQCFDLSLLVLFHSVNRPCSRLTQGHIGQCEDPEAGAVTENKPASRHFYPIALLLVSSHLLVVWLILSLVFLLAKYQ